MSLVPKGACKHAPLLNLSADVPILGHGFLKRIDDTLSKALGAFLAIKLPIGRTEVKVVSAELLTGIGDAILLVAYRCETANMLLRVNLSEKSGLAPFTEVE
jgi:hypothetical protein